MTHRFSRMKMASTTAPSATIRLLNQTCLEVMSVAIGRLRLACTRARCVKWLVKSAFTSICCYLILLFLSQRFPNKDHLFYHKKTHLKERFECLTCHEVGLNSLLSYRKTIELFFFRNLQQKRIFSSIDSFTPRT